jgi:hypothetical protein
MEYYIVIKMVSVQIEIQQTGASRNPSVLQVLAHCQFINNCICAVISQNYKQIENGENRELFASFFISLFVLFLSQNLIYFFL